jgi:hypothetical protein
MRGSMSANDPKRTLRFVLLVLRRKHLFPVVLHVDDEPAALRSLLQGLHQLSTAFWMSVVGVFAVRISVMNDDA